MRLKLPGLKFLALIGIAAILGGFAYDLAFAGLPYPDPTPDLQARWEFHNAIAGWIMAGGFVLLLLSAAATVARRLMGNRLDSR